MFDINTGSVASDGADLEGVADDLHAATRRTAADDRTIYAGVEDAVEDSLSRIVLPMAQEAGSKHVGERSKEIQTGSGRWRGKHYRNGLLSENDVVLAHEYGTGIHRGGSRYRIPARSGGDPIAIDVGGQTRIVEYVMHPGVNEEGFIRDSMEHSLDAIGEAVLDEVGDKLDRALDGL